VHPFVTITLQQAKADCGVASFAMLTGVSYLDAFAAAGDRVHKTGMKTRQIVTMARRLGYVLKLQRAFDVDSDVGLLTVERVTKKATEWDQHMVLLKWGLIFDTDGSVWEPDVYFAQHGFRPLSLLVLISSPGEETE
jgi:hypothetical protein